ncbi:hypothetical protein HRbin30_00525 [bacterium HR30]|nr:hypothetical protein HRbin30_00525 [bacterium HR30]
MPRKEPIFDPRPAELTTTPANAALARLGHLGVEYR